MESQQKSTPPTSTVPEVIQNLLNVLNQSLDRGNNQGQSSVEQRPSVSQEMTRSFPGLFKRGSKRHLHNLSQKQTKMVKQWKPFTFTVYLLHKNCEKTPSPLQDLHHMQAGLGKRTLQMPDDMNHEEVSQLFRSTFPKLNSVTGGWLLYKAPGGNGRRILSVVPPESEGYTGRILKGASGGGKTTLYIVPLQEEFDLAPLPSDAEEFALMPKAQCKGCRQTMPLQVLALHVPECNMSTFSDSEPEITEVLLSEKQPKEGKCPVCEKVYPSTELPLHASVCGDFESHTVSSVDENREPREPQKEIFLSEEDVLQWISAQVDSSKDFCLCVSRINLLERGLMLWQRQKNSSPLNSLKITFMGEAGVDTGALRKEFLTEMINGIKGRLFEGEDGKGKIPKYSLNDLDSGLFRVAGEVFAVSLAQGGPAPKFLHEWCYNFLLNGNIENITLDDVYDPELFSLIKMVEEAEDLSSCTEQILSCGYTGRIDEENKGRITRAIILHSAARRTVMLSQLREGLQLYGLIGVMEQNRDLCKGLFVAGTEDKVDPYYIMAHLVPTLSESGSQKHSKEIQILNNFQDFLQELEDGTIAEGLSVVGVLQWLTGQAHKHLLLTERDAFKITVNFEHFCLERMPTHKVCYPLVSACTQTITFPSAHFVLYSDFKENMITALKFGTGFFRI